MKLEVTEEQLDLLSIAVEAYISGERASGSEKSDDEMGTDTTGEIESADPAAWKHLAEQLRAARQHENASEIWLDYAKSRKVPSNPAPTAGPRG